MKKRMRKKLCSLIIICAMCVTGLPGTAWADGMVRGGGPSDVTIACGEIGQVGVCGDKAVKVYVPEKAEALTGVNAETSVIEITNEYLKSKSNVLNTGWYIVKTNVTYSERITVSGEVHLILAENAILDATKGITVQDNGNNGNSFTIWEQARDTGGTLTAKSDNENSAGIGGGSGGSAGNITINGGTVTGTCTSSESYNLLGAGIGGGSGGSAGTITINGGIVTGKCQVTREAVRSYGAGIGGGNAGSAGTITINDGIVTGISSSSNNESNGAGIGGGNDVKSCITIEINGGIVTGICQSSGSGVSRGAGIGEGLDGPNNAGSNITIKGGIVTGICQASENKKIYGVGIGGCDAENPGKFSTGDAGNAVIFASGKTVNFANGETTISAKKSDGNYSGIIFENGSGAVYGNPTLQMNATVPSENTLTVGAENTLTIGENVTLTNKGTIDNTGGTIKKAPAEKVTFKIQNGTWDGTNSSDQVVDMYHEVPNEIFVNKALNYQPAHITETQIPKDMKPLEGISNMGTWGDEIPVAGMVITESKTFTYTYDQYETPAITIDYENEQLTGFVEDASYTVNTRPVTLNGTAISATEYIQEADNMISIVRKGNGIDLKDSEEQILAIPPRPAIKGLKAVASSRHGKNNGKITGLEPTKTYQYRAKGASEWIPLEPDATEITGLEAGTYEVQIKVSDTNFIGAVAEVIIKERPIPSNPDKTETTENPDGSTTTVITKPDGTTTTATEQPNGDKVIETKRPDGTKITETENAKGDKQKEIKQPDGSGTIEISKADGSKSTTTIEKNGQQITKAVVSDKAAEEAEKENKPIIILTPAKETPKADGAAPNSVINIQVPKTVNEARPLTIVVPVENLASSDVLVIVHEDGRKEVVRKSIGTEDGIKMQITGDVQLKVVNNEKIFNDIANHWAADAIENVTARGIFNGVGNDSFAPDVTTSRAMLVTVLHNLENNPKQTFDGNFSDVDDKAWYTESVKWAAEQGIVSGVGDNNFAPEDTLTREQMVTMLYRYAGSPKVEGDSTEQYSDSSNISSYARDAINWAISQGIVNGVGDNMLSPQGQATRAQLAVVITKLMQL